MIGKLKDLSRKLAPNASLEMPIRLFQLICLVVTAITLFAILPVNLFQNLPILVNIGDVLLGLFAFFCFWESTCGRHHQLLFLIFMALLMEPIWFLNAGTDGSITLYFLVVMVYPMVLFRGKKRWALTACMIFNICALLAIDYFFPSLTVPFRSRGDRVLDLISGAFCSCLALVMIVWVVISSYDRERESTEKQAHDLAETHGRLASTLAAIPDLMFEVDVKGRIYDYYAPATETLYAQPEEFLGKMVGEVLPPDAAGVVLKALRQAATEGSHRGATYALDLPGGRRWFELSIATKPSDSTTDAHLVALARDVTERKRAEVAVQESEEMLRSIFVSSPDAITVVDLFERIKLCNQSTADIHGFSSVEQLIGKNLSELVAEEDHQRMMEAKKHVMIHGIAKNKPFIGLKGNGERFEGELSFSLLKDGSGRPTGFVGITRDITESKRAAEANATLEKKVEERTRELAQRAAQLRALTGELTLAEQRERSRLASVLHDHIQQMLVAAKFRLTVLGRCGDDVVKQATKEVEELIDESILASRSLTAELSPPILQEAGLKDGLQWLARRMADTQGLFVDLELNESGPLPEDLKILLFQSVRELLFNVVKHANTRSAVVNLRRFDGSLQVTVSDQGSGFDPVTMPLAGKGGRGFGLLGIQERLRYMGGKLEIESNPGQGSRFVLSVPVIPAAIEPILQETLVLPEEPLMAAQNPITGLKTRAMLADDHALFRQGVANLLADEPDIEVVGEAADGQEAVDLAAKLLPDVILMDVSMPKLNGVEATRIIHNDWPEILIIGLSMFEDEDISRAIRAAGAVDYVTKSGPAEVMISVIRTIIRSRKHN